jgi:two-component system chemotaxis sensor kinase CheA
MAIMDGMVVRVGRERYIIPTLSIVESFRPAKNDLNAILCRGKMVNHHGNRIPLFQLSELFGIEGATSEPSDGIVVVLDDMGKRTGLLVDILLGQQQTVIKRLGNGLGSIQGISGAAILPDGRVGLILDVAGIIRIATSGETVVSGDARQTITSNIEGSS